MTKRKPLLVTDPSQRIKIAMMIAFGLFFIVWGLRVVQLLTLIHGDLTIVNQGV